MKKSNETVSGKRRGRRGAAHGSTRRQLMAWALARVKTSELLRCKNEGTDIPALAEKGRSENNALVREVERLKKQVADLYEGNRRWREEVVAMDQLKHEVEEAIAKASNKLTDSRAEHQKP